MTDAADTAPRPGTPEHAAAVKAGIEAWRRDHPDGPAELEAWRRPTEDPQPAE